MSAAPEGGINLLETDGTLFVWPWPAGLEKDLTVRRHIRERVPIVTDGGTVLTKVRHGHTKEVLYRLTDDHSTGAVFSGLTDYVKKWLQDRRLETVYTVRRKPLPVPDWSRMTKTLREGQPEILKVMTEHHCATIQAATGLGKSEAIVQFLRVSPGVRVGIVTFTGQVRNSLFRRIRDGDPDRRICVLKSGSIKDPDADTFVMVDKSLHRLSPEEIDVLIIDEAHGAAARGAWDNLSAFVGCRVYGLSATPTGRHDQADLILEALCGPVRINLDYAFSVAIGANVPINAYIYEARGPVDLEKADEHVKIAKGIWRNRQRNNLIAHLASQLASDQQTLITCTSLEHVLCLQKLLPSFTCVANAPDPVREAKLIKWGLLPPGWKDLPFFTTDTDKAREDMEKGTLLKAIVTPLWKEGVDFVHLRWLIRADGKSGPIPCGQIGGRLARRTDEKNWAAIIDFYDRFSGFQWASDQRIQHYQKTGWTVHRIA